MTDLFFYGTLRYRPLLQIVLGHAAEDLNLSEASLAGHAVHAVTGHPFPKIVARDGARAGGLLVRGLTGADLDRLAFYEGGFDYDLRTCAVDLGEGGQAHAEVFFPAPERWQAGAPWSLDDWVADWGAMTLHAAREVMAFYGRRSGADMARSFPAIRMRAAARLAAEARPPDPDRPIDRDVDVIRRDKAYVNYFGFDEMDLRHRRNDGTMTGPLNRSALMTGQASVVLPYDPVRDAVLLVEQFRAPVYMIGDPAPWMWEPVAGMIDPGETPEQAAIREAREEAHLDLRRLERAGGAYSSSGSSTEFLHLFVGLADLTGTVTDGGLDSEGEDIRSRILPFDALMAMVDDGTAKDLPLLMLANWLARHRGRLRDR